MKSARFARLATTCATALVAMPLWAQPAPPGSSTPIDRSVLPIPPQPFTGTAGETIAQSKPMFQMPVRAPAGAPNVLLILTDDVGFGASSTFGGMIPTPNLDRLAARGLRYNRFHTTAICSPTRAALLTGRNHHAVGTGNVADMTSGYPGYSSMMPRTAATVAEVLRLNGYSTAFFGKHHNVPRWQMSAAGPFDLWPTNLGFEYFYGFLGGDTNQWSPKVYRNTTPVPNGRDNPANQLLDQDLADEAIHWIHNQQGADPSKPFFAYYAPGSAHSPHQAPKEWIAKFKGRFDRGWDAMRAETFARQKASGIVPTGSEISPRPAGIPAWSSLPPEKQHFFARMMEVYAAQLAFQDAQVGRVLDELDRMGISDNTLIMFIEGDNGASPEGALDGSMNELGTMVNGMDDDMAWRRTIESELGGPMTYQLLPVGWSWAINTPFQWTKQVASHLGGIRNGLVISWPSQIKDRGGLRSQFGHVTDVMPTILEAAGLPVPHSVDGVEQQKMDGISLRYSFDRGDTPERHNTQYFEILGNRGIYHDGWMANTTPARMPWVMGAGDVSVADYQWELYDLRSDFTQSRNLAAKNPAKLAELRALFTTEAKRNHVFPLDDRQSFDRALPAQMIYAPRATEFTYWGKDISVPQLTAPSFTARSFSITADLVLPAGGGNGVILANGSHFGGWSFFIRDGRLVACHAASQKPSDRFTIEAKDPLTAGPAQIRFDFDYDGGGVGKGGTMRIDVNGKPVASGHIDRTILITAGLGETLDIGRDTGVPVADYVGEAPLQGEIRKVTISLE